MVKTDAQGKKTLKQLGNHISNALDLLPMRNRIKLRHMKSVTAKSTSSDGWRIRLGSIGKNFHIEVRWDRFAAHKERLLWCGVYARRKTVIQELAKLFAEEIKTPLTLDDSDWTVCDGYTQLKTALPQSALGEWVVEFYDKQRFPYFLGAYLDEKATRAAFSSHAVDVTSLFRATCGVSLGDRERTQNERQAVYHGRQDSDLTSGGQWPSGLGCLSRT